MSNCIKDNGKHNEFKKKNIHVDRNCNTYNMQTYETSDLHERAWFYKKIIARIQSTIHIRQDIRNRKTSRHAKKNMS